LKYFEAYLVLVVSKRIEMTRQASSLKKMALPPKVAVGVRNAGGFVRILRTIPERKKLSGSAKFHLALSEKTRLRILWALSRSDFCPCLLKKITRMSDSRLSYHLRILRSAGLIRSRRTKNWRIYSITQAGRAALK